MNYILIKVESRPVIYSDKSKIFLSQNVRNMQIAVLLDSRFPESTRTSEKLLCNTFIQL